MEPGSGVKFQTKKHPRAKVADSENLENGTGTVPIVDLQKKTFLDTRSLCETLFLHNLF